MKLEHLDQRFLSKSARARLGAQCPSQATPTTTSTLQATLPTGCDTTGENGSCSKELHGMTGFCETRWWDQDLSHWPGPSEEIDLRATWIAYRQQITLAARAWSKSFEAAAEAFQSLGAALADPVQQDKPKQLPQRYAPPRTERTFDRMGRRLR